MTDFLLLTGLKRHADAGLLLLRAGVGAFLVWGVWDNVVDATHMQTFVAFLARYGFPLPELMARLSVWAQFAVGLAFVTGTLTRWAGIVCAINFVVAIVMVDRHGGIRAMFPAACLVMIGVYLALAGAGRYALDARLERTRAAP